nr:polyprotein [buhirugu virus 15]
MDCSNPVDVNDRQTVGAVLEERRVRLRQDLGYVDDLVRMEERRHLGTGQMRSEEEVKAVLQRIEWPRDEDQGGLDLGFLEEMGEVAVCSLTDEDGRPLHPPTVNQKGMKVSVLRRFGNPNRPRETVGLLARLQNVDGDQLVEVAERTVYSYGTREGFVKRLKELTSRTCVSVGRGAVKRLKNLLPLEEGGLPDWNAPLEELLMGVEVTKRSSAGAPTWARKGEAMERVVQEIMPIVVGHMSKEGLQTLRQELPELFLCEVKNKLDRYEVAKLSDKTRPYVAQPLHFSLLFSFLSQSFTKCMKLCVEAGHNAYGLAYTGGRLTDLYERKLKGLKREVFYMAYGDDMDIFFRREGVLYRVSPDSRQMDGSVDEECGKAVISYVVDAFRKQWGPSEFWEAVAKLWLEFSFYPTFLVEGTMTYRKKQRDGLMSGAVGTTLFDTAKAVLCAEKFATSVENGEVDPFDAERSIRYFAKLGLEIKPETWKPERCNEGAQAGTLFGRNKFLGVRWQWMQGAERMELVPALDADEWLKMLAVPRDHPDKKRVSGGGPGAQSNLMAQRTLFDRCRGLLITGAAFSEEARAIIYGVIDQIPGTAIVMGVQAAGGKGEKPEESLFLGDFSFSNASGVPTPEGVLRLYSKGGVGAGLVEIYPRVAERLEGLRRMPAPRLVKKDFKLKPEERVEKPIPTMNPPVEPGYSAGELGRGRPKKTVDGVLHDRNTRAMSFEQMLDSMLGDDEAVPVSQLCERMAVEPAVLYPRLVAMGFAFSSREGEAYVSKFPLRDAGEARRKERLEARTAIISARTSMLSVKLKQKALERPAALAGVVVKDLELISQLEDPGPVKFEGALNEVMQSVQQYLSRCGWAPRWKGSSVLVGKGADRRSCAKLVLMAVEDVPATKAARVVSVVQAVGGTKRLCQYAIAFRIAQQADKFVQLAEVSMAGTRTWTEEMEFVEACDRQKDILELETDTKSLEEDECEEYDGANEKAEEAYEQESEGGGGRDPGQGDGGLHDWRDGEENEEEGESEESQGSNLWGDPGEEEGAFDGGQSTSGGDGFIRQSVAASQVIPMAENVVEGVREVPVGVFEDSLETGSGNHSWRAGDPGGSVGCDGSEARVADGHSGPNPQQNPCSVGGWGEVPLGSAYVQTANPQVVYHERGGGRWLPWPAGAGCVHERSEQIAGRSVGGICDPDVWDPGCIGRTAPWPRGAYEVFRAQCVRAQELQALLQSSKQILHTYPRQVDGLSGFGVKNTVRDRCWGSLPDLQGGREVGREGPGFSLGQSCVVPGSGAQVGVERCASGQDGAFPGVSGVVGRPARPVANVSMLLRHERARSAPGDENRRLEVHRCGQENNRNNGFCRGKPCPGADGCRCVDPRDRQNDVHGVSNVVVDGRPKNRVSKNRNTKRKKSIRFDDSVGGDSGRSRDGDRLSSLESSVNLILDKLSRLGDGR